MKSVKDLLKDEVARLTYKPGWSFAVETYVGLGLSDEIIALAVKADAICVDSGQPITINRSFPYPERGNGPSARFQAFLEPSSFLVREFIIECIEEVERHEVAEWLRFDGVCHYAQVHTEDGY